MPALSPSDLTADPAGEPRVLDLALAERLGFERPRKIRDLIEQNRAELEGYGELVEVDGVTLGSPRGGANLPGGSPGSPANPGGRPGRAFMLTEDQARLTAILSRAPHAPAVRRQLIEAFNAYRTGRAAGLAPLPADPVAEAVATLVPPGGPTWEGSPAELLRVLTRLAPATDRAALGWPRSPRGLGVAVDRLAPEMRAGGIAIERRRSASRIIRLSRCRPTGRPALPTRQGDDGSGELARLRSVIAGQAEELGALRGRLAALEIRTGRAA